MPHHESPPRTHLREPEEVQRRLGGVLVPGGAALLEEGRKVRADLFFVFGCCGVSVGVGVGLGWWAVGLFVGACLAPYTSHTPPTSMQQEKGSHLLPQWVRHAHHGRRRVLARRGAPVHHHVRHGCRGLVASWALCWGVRGRGDVERRDGVAVDLEGRPQAHIHSRPRHAAGLCLASQAIERLSIEAVLSAQLASNWTQADCSSEGCLLAQFGRSGGVARRERKARRRKSGEAD